MLVHTARGIGRVVDEMDEGRGRRSYKVAGDGWSEWVPAARARVASEGAVLPWDPGPQYPSAVMPDEQTLAPGERVIDPDERLSPSDSVSGRPRDLPAGPDCFASPKEAGISDGYWPGADENGDCRACRGTGRGGDGEACWPCHGEGHNDTWADRSNDGGREHPNRGNRGWDGVHRPGVSPWREEGIADPRRRYRRGSRLAVNTDGMDPSSHAYGRQDYDPLFGEFGHDGYDYEGVSRAEFDRAMRHRDVERETEDAREREDDESGYNWGPEPAPREGRRVGMHDLVQGPLERGSEHMDKYPGTEELYRLKYMNDPRERDRGQVGGWLEDVAEAQQAWLDAYRADHPAPEDDEPYVDEDGYRMGAAYAGLSDKYVRLAAPADHFGDPVQRFRDDPFGEIERVGNLHLSRVEEDPRMREYVALVEHDERLRTAAWKDVRAKALRLRAEGKVTVNDVGEGRIYATVEGDHGVYDTMIVKGGSLGVGAQSISNWHCACPWGYWAFKRRYSYVGRLCSHGYAAYLEMQSRHHKENPIRRYNPAGPNQYWLNRRSGARWVLGDSYTNTDIGGGAGSGSNPGVGATPNTTPMGGETNSFGSGFQQFWNGGGAGHGGGGEGVPEPQGGTVATGLPDIAFNAFEYGLGEGMASTSADDTTPFNAGPKAAARVAGLISDFHAFVNREFGGEVSDYAWSKFARDRGVDPGEWDQVSSWFAKHPQKRRARALGYEPERLVPEFRVVPGPGGGRTVDVEEDERTTVGPDDVVGPTRNWFEDPVSVKHAMRAYYAGKDERPWDAVIAEEYFGGRPNFDPRHPDDRWERDDPRGRDFMPNYRREGRTAYYDRDEAAAAARRARDLGYPGVADSIEERYGLESTSTESYYDLGNYRPPGRPEWGYKPLARRHGSELGNDLVQAQGEEVEGIGQYQQFLEDARAAGDEQAASMIEEILGDEHDHARELADAVGRRAAKPGRGKWSDGDLVEGLADGYFIGPDGQEYRDDEEGLWTDPRNRGSVSGLFSGEDTRNVVIPNYRKEGAGFGQKPPASLDEWEAREKRRREREGAIPPHGPYDPAITSLSPMHYPGDFVVELPDASDEELVGELLRNRAPHGRVPDEDKDWDDDVLAEFGRREGSWFGQLAAAPDPGEPGDAGGAHQPFNGSGHADTLEQQSSDAWVAEHESAGLVDVTDLGDGPLVKDAKIVDILDGDGVIKYGEEPAARTAAAEDRECEECGAEPGEKCRPWCTAEQAVLNGIEDAEEDRPTIERFAENLPPGWGGNPDDPAKDEEFPLPPGMGPVMDGIKQTLPKLPGLLGDAAAAGEKAEKAASSGPKSVRRIGGGLKAGESPAQDFSDNDIAAAAAAFLRTAGRVYSPAEQKALEEEAHPGGARNLASLDLDGTHYLA